MIPFLSYLKDYLRSCSRSTLISTMLLLTVLIIINYTWGIESRIRHVSPWPLSWLYFFLFYSSVYLLVWMIQGGKRFFWLLIAGPAYFAAKMIHWDLAPLFPASWQYPWDSYAQIVGQLPVKLLFLLFLLYLCARWEGRTDHYGLTRQGFNARPYFVLLLCLVPLVALASTRPDFLHAYPKVKNIAFISPYTSTTWPWQLLYELSYGLDFVSIELFFRGFLVIGLARYAGESVILPMAAFYCTIHFGKPLGECISSFFGGLALGVIALRTGSIYGGLIIHLGLAWMMEAGGWLGGLFRM